MAKRTQGRMGRSGQRSLSRRELVDDFASSGVVPGGVLMVHSSLSSIGHVDGGAETVVDALLDVLGPHGTLMLPTFTYVLANDDDFVFDPLNTPSLMGAISEAGRRRPEALRSIHARHSLVALGPLAETITKSGNGSAWDLESPMAKVIHLDGMFMMLGLTYEFLTAIHICEVELGVSYRRTQIAERRICRADGSVVPLFSRVHRLVEGGPDPDFNRLGQQMDDDGAVKFGEVGNAVTRMFYGHDLRRKAREMYEEDPDAFLKKDGVLTRLTRGHTIWTPRGELCVVDPAPAHNAA